MNPKNQNIAIAEVCGWKRVMTKQDGPYQIVVPWDGSQSNYTWVYPDGWQKTAEGRAFLDNRESAILYPPSYTSCLNAMHEAEKVLDIMQCLDYQEKLGGYREDEDYWDMLHATAAQRAEAFLKTLNLWTSE